jgi:MoaA/NifB/PqqE/SkfB family radical SAM enzyme
MSGAAMHIDLRSTDISTTRIADELAARLISSRGADGMTDLVERLRPYWNKICAARLATYRGTDAKALAEILIDAATGGDHPDLVTSEIRIRPLGAGPGGWDLGVCAAIARALLEALFDEDKDQVHQTALAIWTQPAAQAWRGIGIFNLVVSRLHLDRGEFDLAATAAKKNLDVFLCPTSQFLLYRSLAAKARDNAPTGASEIFIGDLSDRFCAEPFNTIATGSGRLGGPPAFFACSCPGTLPYPLAASEPDATRERLWNGPEIQEIRRSILEGDFTYCSRKACPYIVHGTLPARTDVSDPRLRDIIDNHRVVLDTPPVQMTLGHDPSCNLACPSCRTELITLKNEARAAFDEASRNILLPLLEGASAMVIISTDGDPFASKHYRNLLHSFDPVRHAGINIALITNGLLLTRDEWESLGHVQRMIACVGVSIDGARRETYENLRRPGKWSVIHENMERLATLRREGKLPYLNLQFVVQRENFEEMAEFVSLGKQWGVDLIRFIRLVNIGSYDATKFEENDVCDPRHPLFPRLLQMLRNPVFADPVVDMFTLRPLYEQALRDRPAKTGIMARLAAALRERMHVSA